MSNKKYTVTAALLYANGPAHIGHLAGCYIPADIYSRFLRSRGDDVVFVTGSDEHGVPITIKAEKEGLTPQQVVDKYHKIIKDTFEGFGISPDIYSRTSNPVHHQTAQDFFKTLYDKGKFTEETTEQYYDPKAQKFLADRYIVGTCPKCANDKAYGDQCEKCGSTLSPDELINPHSALSGEKPIKKSTKNWYLPLDKIQKEFLDEYIAKHSHWKANVFGQCNSWLKEGLKPRAMTRDLDWGIKLPLPDTDGKVLYVWFDAPIGYISMLNEYFEKHNDAEYLEKYNVGIRKSQKISSPLTPEGGLAAATKAPQSPKEEIFLQNFNATAIPPSGVRGQGASFWNDSKIVHFIGKDNIVFHSLIFPAMCHEHGGYKVADEVPANEFLNLEGDKISTSRNWAVWAHEYLEDFPDKQDVLRYFLTSNAPENKDNNFTWKDFQTANNSELVGILGNFVNRVLVLTEKYYEGKVPNGKYTKIIPADEVDEDGNIQKGIVSKEYDVENEISVRKLSIFSAIEKFKFREAVQQLMNLARSGNKYLADTEPWKLIKTDPEKTKDIMFSAIQITFNLAIFMEPFMPFTAKKLFKMLNVSDELNSGTIINHHQLPAGHQLGKPALLFEKIEDEAIAAQMAKLVKPVEVPPIVETLTSTASQKPNVSFDEFAKMDIRIGTILEAEKVEKADKLLKLKIDTGIDIRTVVSGIAMYHKPEEIVGKQVSILVNLEPRKIRGIESQGMILMAEDADGRLDFVKPISTIKNGSEVR